MAHHVKGRAAKQQALRLPLPRDVTSNGIGFKYTTVTCLHCWNLQAIRRRSVGMNCSKGQTPSHKEYQV